MTARSRPAGPAAARPARRGWRRLFTWRVFLWTTLSVFVLVVAAVAYAYAITPIPSVNEVARAQASIIYYADGTTEMARLSEINRESIPLAEVPMPVRNAMLAAEDRDFYGNPGISPTGLARAVWVAVRGGPTQGGSTITQQYVKNSRLSQEQTMTRKFKELIISLKIERELSKDEILENYLNTIYYGRGAYGIKTAARAYFGKEVKDLTVADGALLASVIRGPSLYDPALGARQLKNVKERFGYVLDGMVEQGWLSAATKAKTVFPAVAKPVARAGRSGPNGYLVDVVRNELVNRGIVSEDQVLRGGLRVVTTIDPQTQADAVKAVERNRPNSGKGANIHVALASVKPGDGAILALYGGRDFATQQFNDATQGHFQGGSTFKVFTLVGALQKGISTKTGYDGNSPVKLREFVGPGNPEGKVQNFGNHSYGPLTLKDATAKSSNTVFAQVNVKVGPDTTVRVAKAMGLPDDLGADIDESTPGLQSNPANVFGTAAARPIDMAEAYATLAAGGVHTDPYIVRSVSSVDGGTSYQVVPSTQSVLNADVAADAVDAMQEVLRSGTATGARFGRPAAGKTGTTSENRAVWFVGFTPQVSTAVAMYLPDENGNAVPMRNIAGLSEITGASFPVKIWSAFMSTVHDGMAIVQFPERVGIGDDRVVVPEPTTSAPSPSSSSMSSMPTQTTQTTGPSPSSSLPTPGPTQTTTPTTSTPTRSRTSPTGGAGAIPGTGPPGQPDPATAQQGGGGAGGTAGASARIAAVPSGQP